MTPEEELQKLLNTGGNQNQPPANETTTTGSGTNNPTPAPVQQPMQDDTFWGSGQVNAPEELAIQTQQTTTNTNTTPPTGTTPSGTQNNASVTQASPKPAGITRETINTSARTAVAAIDLAQMTILRPLMNWRFTKEGEKRFGNNFQRGMEMIMTDEVPTDAKEKAVKTRILKFLNQRDQKIKEIPFSDEEEQDMERAFKAYFEMKQVAMAPEVLLYCSVISTIGKRAVDVFMWD